MQTIWGSDCGRVKIIGNRIRTVNAKNGEKSELYDSILDHIKDLPKEDLEALQEQYKSWEGKYIHTTDDLKHLALAMYAQTTSENFKKWFQDSKVVDKNGEPILIYHGTNKTFDSFNLDKEGVSYFTPNIDRGKLYGNNIYPVFLNISDPLIQNNKNFENLTRPEAIKIAKINNDGLIIEMNKGNTYLIFSNNQVKSLFNKGEYKKENPNIYQQQSGNTVSSKASPETIGRYKEWAKRAGFDLDDTLSHLTDEKGNKLDANGRVDLLRKAIQIVSGKSDIAVGEEVSHGIVSIIKQTNPALFKEMMNSVGKYDLYSKVVAEYGSDSNYQIDGKPNIPKLKEETLGKILNELIINRLEGSTEKPELLQRTQTFWDKIKSFFKDLLSKIGFDPTSDPIDKAAKEFTEGKIQNPVKDLTDKKKDETYQDFKKRTLDEIQSIADVVPDKTAIITHGTVIGLLKGIDKGKETTSSQVDNGEIYTKEINGKTLYFVRHGQSEANITKEDATPETPLTQKGKEDAKNTAQKLKDLGVTNVFSTDTTRTKDTASIIRNILNPTIENKFNSLLPQEKINYQLKVTKALQSLSAKNLFDRFYNTGNKEKFYNELLQLGATKDQVNLLKELNEIEDPKSIEDMWTNVMAQGNNILLQRTNQEKDKEEQTFLQKSKEENDKEEQESLYNKINTKSSVELKDKDKEDSHYEDTVTGKKVNRVTDRAKKFLKNLFKTKGKETEGDKAIQDLKKEAGTQYHAAIAHIHERAINSDGTLKIKIVNGERRVDLSDVGILPEGVDEGFYNTLQNHLYGYTDNAKVYHEGMISNPTSFPEGTKFLWEKTIYNPNSTIDGVKGEAGTVDFMAIKPDKKIDLFDWKFLGSLLENKTIMDYMKTAYDRQMSGYKAILMSDAYGVKEEDLEKSRMIPIAVQYDKNTGEVKNMSIGDADYKVEQPDYMLPYITSQEKTGNEDLDKLINSLSGIVEKLRKKSMNEMDKAISLQKIHNIEKAILHIGLMRSFDPLISQAKNFTTETFNNLQDIKKKLTTTKLNLNKKEDLIKVKNEIMSPLVEMKDDLEVYKTLGNLTTFLDKDDPERKDLEKISKDAGNLIYGVKDQNGNIKINGVKGILYEFWNQYAATRGIKDLIENQTKLASFWNELDTLSTSQLSTLHGLYDLMNIKQHIVEQESNEFLPGLLDIQKKLEEWGSFKNMLDLLYKKNYKDKQTTGQIKELIDEFDSQFYTELEKRIDAQQWHGKEGVENLIDRDKFQDWATRTREQKMEAWEHTSFLKPEDKQERKEQIERETDLSGKYAWSNYNVLKEFAKEDWHSKGFKELSKPENKAVKDLYDFIIDTNQIAAESGYIQYNKRKNSLPQITKSLAEKFSLGGQWNAVDKLLESITVSGEEQGIEVRNKVTGELIPVLPRYFIRDLSFENKEGERDYSTVSDDLVKNIGMFRYKVLDYKAKSDLQDLVEGLHYLEKYKQVKETNKSGNTTGKLLDDNSHNEKVFDDAMKQHLYDMHILSSYDAKSGKSFEVAGEKRSISAIKTADTLKSAYSFAVLGCNSVTSVFRSITTGAAALYNAGRYYTYKQVMKSYWDFCAMKGLSDYALHVELLKNFLPVEENLHLGLEKLTANSVTAIDLQDAMMKWVKSAHNIVQYVNYLAHMDNAIVINGKVMNARDYYRNTDEYKQKYSSEANRKEIDKGFDAKVQSLINDHGLLKKAKLVDGKLNIEGLDMNDFSVADLKSTIRVGGRMLSGNISENDQSHIRSNSLLRQMFLYTNWLPQAARQRLRGITYNEGMRKYEYGREHMLWDILTKGEGGIPQRCKNLINIGMGNEAGVKALNEMYHYHKDEYLKKTGKELHMDSTEFNDMIRENMKIQGRELLTLLTFAGMAMGLYALAPKKDEEGYEESIGYFTFMKRVVNRCKDELEIFYNPATFAQFGSGSKFPLLSYLSDAGTALHSIGKEGFGLATGDEESLEKVHAAVHVTNVLPIGRSIEQNLFFIDPEMYHYLFPGGTVPDEPKGGSR